MQILYAQNGGKILGTTCISEVLRETARNFICPPVLSSRSQLMNKEEVSWLSRNSEKNRIDSVNSRAMSILFTGQRKHRIIFQTLCSSIHVIRTVVRVQQGSST